MLKKQFKLPQTKGNYCFQVDFKGELTAKGAIFVIRPVDDGNTNVREAECSLSWSKSAQGFFAYSPEISSVKTVLSRNFDVDFPTSIVEIEIMPWGSNDIEEKISGFTLISKPSSNDERYTTFMGGLND